jgi:hypothetical protein
MTTLNIYVTDKTRTDEEIFNFSNYLELETATSGTIDIVSTGEFSVQHITVQGSLTYKIKLDMNMNPDPYTAEVWGILVEEVTRTAAGNKPVYQYIPDELYSFKNKVRVTITNNSGGTQEHYFFISASPRQLMPHRKY